MLLAHAAELPALTNLYAYVAYSSGLLGTVGAIAVILTYILFEDMRTTSRALMLFLSLCDLGMGMRFLSIDLDYRSVEWCTFQSVWGLWVTTASFLWTASISIYVYSVLRTPNVQFPRWALWLFHIVSWGYPTCFAFINVDEADRSVASPLDQTRMLPWCYMSTQWSAELRALVFVVPLFVSWIVTVCMYSRAYRIISSYKEVQTVDASLTNQPHELREMSLKFIYIPIVFIVLRSFDAIQNVYMLIWGMESIPFSAWFTLAQLFCDAAQGFFNCVVFVYMTANVRHRLFQPRASEVEYTHLTTGIRVQYNGKA